MVERKNKRKVDAIGDEKLKQILRFLVFNNYPHLLIKEDGKKKLWRMEGRVSLKFLERRCISCGKKIETGYLCKECKSNDPIRISASFDGFNGWMLKSIENKEHVVYIASKDGMWKIGSTQKRRFTQRMLEQGIDFGGIIAGTKNGTIARKIETLIYKNFDINDRFKKEVKPPILPPHLIDFRKFYKIPDGNFENVNFGVQGEIIGWKGPEIFFDCNKKTNLKWWVGSIIE